MSAITVVRTAAPILVEDLGRHGFAKVGVPTAGAFDRGSARLAQRLVGNPQGAAVLELMLGRAVLATDATVTAALTGAEVGLAVDGRDVAVNEVFSWPAGSMLAIGLPRSGMRSYLAVSGGFAVSPVLGSASADVLSGLGPLPLSAGDTVALARAPATQPVIDFAPADPPSSAPIRIVIGPRDDWFEPKAVTTLMTCRYTVDQHSNRVGLRLSGPRLHRLPRGELPSEPLQRGAMQVPPSGQPIIMGPDHPTTGGYPVVACVIEADWDRCGQLRPGETIAFARVG